MLKKWCCEGAAESLEDALEKACSGNKQRKASMRKRLDSLVERLCRGARLSKDSFPKEGDLPGGGSFYAIKKMPVRVYCWFGKNKRDTLFISHACYKKRDKLSQSDASRTISNFERWDEP